MNTRIILASLIVILLLILSTAVVKQIAMFLFVAVVVAIVIATLKIKENYDSMLTDSATAALNQLDNETCAPFLRLGQDTPDFVKQQRLKKYERETDTCYIKLKDNLFDNDRNPATACSRNNPQLFASSHSNLVQSISPANVIDDGEGEFGADNVCLIKFDSNALKAADAVQKLQEYGTYVSSRDPTVFRLTSDNTNLTQRNANLQNQVGDLSRDAGKRMTEIENANSQISSLQTQLQIANNAIKNMSTSSNLQQVQSFSTSGLKNFTMSDVAQPFVWLRMNELEQQSTNSRISIWPGAYGTTAARGQTVGNAPLPIIMVENGVRFVRLSNLIDQGNPRAGSFFTIGQQRFGANSQGFTLIANVRFFRPAVWERLIDFGNGPGQNNIVIARIGNSNEYWLGSFNDGQPVWMTQQPLPQISANKSWEWVAIRIQNGSITYANKTTLRTQPSWSPFQERTLSFTYIGRSNWEADELANMDIQQMLIYNRALSDNEMQSVLSRL